MTGWSQRLLILVYRGYLVKNKPGLAPPTVWGQSNSQLLLRYWWFNFSIFCNSLALVSYHFPTWNIHYSPIMQRIHGTRVPSRREDFNQVRYIQSGYSNPRDCYRKEESPSWRKHVWTTLHWECKKKMYMKKNHIMYFCFILSFVYYHGNYV